MNIYQYISNKCCASVGNTNMILCLIVMVTILIMVYVHYKTPAPVQEGMDVGKELKTAISGIKDVGSKISQIPGKINNVASDINSVPDKVKDGVRVPIRQAQNAVDDLKRDVNNAVDKVEDAADDIKNSVRSELNSFLKKVKTDVTKIVTEKIKRFFVRFADEFKGAFVDPMAILFMGIGTVFTELGKILKKIIDKIATLPECVPYYSLSVGNNMSQKFLPGWLKFIIRVWQAILSAILYISTPFLRLLGIDVIGWKNEIRRKCFKLETKSHTDKIKGSMEKAGNTFLRSFGRVNFKRVVS